MQVVVWGVDFFTFFPPASVLARFVGRSSLSCLILFTPCYSCARACVSFHHNITLLANVQSIFGNSLENVNGTCLCYFHCESDITQELTGSFLDNNRGVSFFSENVMERSFNIL